MSDKTIDTQQVKLDILRQSVDRIVSNHHNWVLTTSFSLEDMLLFHVLHDAGYLKKYPSAVWTLNTGMLPKETLFFIKLVEAHYGYSIQQIYPDSNEINQYVIKNGEYAFYESLELRHACCAIRKLTPLLKTLQEKLKGNNRAWITGQRRQQSVTRANLNLHEYDEKQAIHKYNPLYDWSYEEVWQMTEALKIPYHPLYDQGYQSIGCAPCTRAVQPGEDERSGRWWWELPEQKECGIHWSNGKLVRGMHQETDQKVEQEQKDKELI
jgi:phosphoadenosine phosphosulfate reductase